MSADLRTEQLYPSGVTSCFRDSVLCREKGGSRMSTPMLAAAIVLSAAITFGLRALPFLIFSGERKMPDWLQKLLAVLVVAVSYHFKRSTFLSIFLGTAAYMLLLHFC